MKMKTERKNCWELKKCGREPGGDNSKELGVCPAALPNRYDGVNNGKCGGRVCWIVAGTANREMPAKSAKKLWECIQCDILMQIYIDEKKNFILFPQIEEEHNAQPS
jgi:hypothetical protein